MRNGGNRLSIVDDRRATIQSNNSREGRLDTRNTTLALERFHQGRFFTDLVGARSSLRDHIKINARAEDVLAEKTACIGVGHGLFHDLEQITVLAAQVNKSHLRANGESGDNRTLNHCMRIVQKDQVVLASPRLALVTIYKDVFGPFRLLGYKRPLHPGRKACATASAKTAGLHLVDDPVRALLNGKLGGLITIQFEVFVNIFRTKAKAAGDDLYFIGVGDEPWHLTLSPFRGLLCSLR